MADTLKDFLVSIGFNVDATAASKVEAAVTRHEAKITAAVEAEGQKRISREEFRRQLQQTGNNDLSKVRIETERKTSDSLLKVAKESTARQSAVEIDAHKKARERRDQSFKDVKKQAVQFEAVMGRVAVLAAGVGSALVGSSALQSFVGSAGAYSQLAMQSQRTRSAPGNISALMYGLGQVGVSQGEASSSFEGFTKALRDSPGLKSVLAGAGVNVDQDPAKVFADLGKYFNSMPYNVALARAGQMGIGENAMLGLQKPGLQGKIGEYGGIAGAFGLDPGKASQDGREFTAAWDKVSTDLGTIKDKIEADFFKPMADGLNGLSKWMEQHPDLTVKLGEGLVAFAGLMSFRVIPALLRLTGLMRGLVVITPPAWVLSALGLAGAAALGASAESTPGEGVSSDPAVRAQQAEENRRLTANANAGDRRNWWQRHAPKWAGGQDAGASLRDAANRGRRHPIAQGSFTDKAPSVMTRLKADFGLGDEDAAAVLGNLGHESAGFTAFNEGRNGPGRGWAQWTDPGRKARFFDYAKQNGLDVHSDEANYGFLKWELQNTHKGAITALKNARGLEDKVSAFEGVFEGAGVKAYGSRNRYARMALGAYNAQPAPTPKFGRLDPNAFKTSPLGVTPSLYNAYDNSRSRGDSNFNQNVTINGVQRPSEVAGAVKAQARRGGQDYIRMMEGSTQ